MSAISNVTKNNTKAVYVGAAVAFVAFLLVGAIPALLYGGYLGLMMGNALFGGAGELSLLTRMMTGGGMLLGFFAVMGLFLVGGGVLGTLFGAGVEKVGALQSRTGGLPGDAE